MVRVNTKNRPENEQVQSGPEAFTGCDFLIGGAAFGHSDGTEVARYLARHCSKRVATAAGDVNSYEGVKAFSESDFTDELKRFDSPALVLHGEDDQIVPVKDSAWKSAKLTKGGGNPSSQSPARTHGHKSGLSQRRPAGAFLKSSQKLEGGLM
jgi:predicted esterase